MTTRDRSQRSRKAKTASDADGRELSAWRKIPIEELRRFMTELVADSNLREAGRLIGRGREAVRRFVGGDIDTPHDRTREAMARLYLQRHGQGVLTASEAPQVERTTTPLKLLLPRGVEKATAEVRAMFDVFRRHGELKDELPESAWAIETWLLKRVKEEYAAEVPYARPRKRAPRKKPAEGEGG